jgi:hypothetical protein
MRLRRYRSDERTSAMPWDLTKCTWGTPVFDNAAAAAAVSAANFTASVYVQTSAGAQLTKKAFTYVVTGGYRICVVGDAHRADTASPWTIAGNSYIPGWLGDGGAGWDTPTPAAQLAVIGPLADSGAFPGDDRYPHPSA